jgi:hypothetical protein
MPSHKKEANAGEIAAGQSRALAYAMQRLRDETKPRQLVFQDWRRRTVGSGTCDIKKTSRGSRLSTGFSGMRLCSDDTDTSSTRSAWSPSVGRRRIESRRLHDPRDAATAPRSAAQTAASGGKGDDPGSRFPGRGSLGTREQPAHEPLIRRAMLAEVPLTGLALSMMAMVVTVPMVARAARTAFPRSVAVVVGHAHRGRFRSGRAIG